MSSDTRTLRELLGEMGQLAGFIANCPDLIVAQEAASQICRRERAALELLNNAKLDIFASRFDRVPESEHVDAVRLAPETRHVSIPDPERGAP